MAETSGLDMIISVFVRYPEFNSVKYEAGKDQLKIEIALNKPIVNSSLVSFISKVEKCLLLYNKTIRIQPSIFKLENVNQSNITLLRFYRDIKTLTKTEIEIFVGLLRENFGSMLVIDEDISTESEERYARQIKKSLLHNQKSSEIKTKNFFAYRDHGTMFVFNK